MLSWDSSPSRVCSGMAPGTARRTDTRENGPKPELHVPVKVQPSRHVSGIDLDPGS